MNGGLNRFDRTDESFEAFDFGRCDFNDFGSWQYYEDRSGTFLDRYLPEAGIHLFDRDKGISIYNISEKDGLANNLVNSILCKMSSGNLWIGTDNGLSRLDPDRPAVLKTTSLLMAMMETAIGGMVPVKTLTGEMLFGNMDGFHNVSSGQYKR